VGSFSAAISLNGRFVALTSDSTDLTMQPASGARDVYVRNMQTAKSQNVSLAQDRTAAGSVTSTRRFVASARCQAPAQHPRPGAGRTVITRL